MAKIKMKSPAAAQSALTFEQLYERFLIDRTAQGLAEKTLQSYRTHLKSIAKHLEITLSFGKLTQDDIDNMVVSMRQSGLAPSSIESYLRVLNTFFRWSARTDLKIPKYKAPEVVKETYTDEELRLLLARPSAGCSFVEYRSWVIVNFLLNSGCRAGTLRSIQNRDVDLEHRQVISRHNKNNRIQSIPLCSQMVIILREYQKIRGGGATDSLFCDAYGGPLSENALRLAMERYNKSRGVESTEIHKFRHTFARKFLVDCGGNAFTLQRLLNHSTLKMTRHYCNVFDADIAKSFDQSSPLAQMKTPERVKIHR